MEDSTIDVDYLVIGAGASAMAFVDSMLPASDGTFAIIDRHARPGGHWNDAYPFVRLHQPSTFYGVNSMQLGDGTVDAVGLNRGLRELATGCEVLEHFDRVMQRRLLPSGRVKYFPMSNHSVDGNGVHCATSLTSGQVRRFHVRRKTVNATHAGTLVPSTHLRQYGVAEGVDCIPPNDLPRVQRPYRQYVVVGGGKTAMDTCLWLLQNDVPESGITWIVPRDSWLIDRGNIQPGPEFRKVFIGSLLRQFNAIANARTVPDLFRDLEETGQLLRIDRNITPSMYHCATISQLELAELRRINHVVRLGRVISVGMDRIVLEKGEVAKETDAIVVDCSAHGLFPISGVKAFDGATVNLVLLRTCQPCFSAALIGYVESHFENEDEKNDLCGVVPVPMVPNDWIRMWAATLDNRQRWSRHPGIERWIASSRLDGMASILGGVTEDEPEIQALLREYRASVKPAVENLPRLARLALKDETAVRNG